VTATQDDDGPTLPVSTAGPPTGGHQANNRVVVWLGTVIMFVVGLALISSVINLWPVVDRSTAMTPQGVAAMTPTMRQSVNLLFGLVSLNVTPSTALILLVLVVGASGSLVHTATSFADFVGNRSLYSSWVVWYLLRVIIGMILALVLYFAVRGGFFSASSQSDDVNPYGIAALAGLAGLFSKQATDKLREVFETLFQVNKGGDASRKDDLTPPAPTVAGIDPSRATPGAQGFNLTVHGDHFTSSSVVRVNGVKQPTRFVNAQELVATLPDALVAAPAALHVTVFTKPPGGGESSPPAVLGVGPPA
jgi:hypothetical protein